MLKKFLAVLCLLIVGFTLCACEEPKDTVKNIRLRCEEAGLFTTSGKAEDYGLNVNEGFVSAYLATDEQDISILIITFRNSAYAKDNFEIFKDSSQALILSNSKLIGRWVICYSDAAKDIVRL